MAAQATIDVDVDVQLASVAGGVPKKGVIRSWVRSAVASAGMTEACEVSVRVVDEKEGRTLNSTFRKVDKATNVLSFSATTEGLAGLPPGLRRPLGDIVVCAPVVEREAQEQGKAITDHWAHMLVHGTLHLLGYDHERDEDARRMEALEKRILAEHGLADPYARQVHGL